MTLAPVAVFGAYIGYSGNMSQQNQNTFDTSKMFSSLILIALVANPLIHVFQIIPNLGAAVGCAKRVEEFLKREELVDSRSDLKVSEGQVQNNKTASEANQATAPDSSPLIVSIQDADIAWDEKDLLKNVNLQVAKGQHIAITGSVGSGKSLLLQAMLGEVAPKSGSIHIRPGVSVGYCTQTAWLENLSVRDNAFRGAPEDPAWRERVIDACALRELLASEVAGSTIGSGGSKISGGEKQRLVSIVPPDACFEPRIILADMHDLPSLWPGLLPLDLLSSYWMTSSAQLIGQRSKSYLVVCSAPKGSSRN